MIIKEQAGEQSASQTQTVTEVAVDETFNFSCHKGVPCFTECCRMLELAVTPYDVLRLKRATNLSSDKFLENYILIEQDPGEAFPRYYLTMVDDGRASCVFVKQSGCSVYENRPAACRAYPVGRAVMRDSKADLTEHFVLVKEEHCLGFQEPVEQTVISYSKDQELTVYNRFNDAMTELLHHDSVQKGFIPSRKQVELFTLALYNLDQFRSKLFANKLATPPLSTDEQNRLKNDEDLLLYGIQWLKKELFILG